MARQSWNILTNTFELKTRNSYKKAFMFAAHLHGVTSGPNQPAFIQQLHTDFDPIYRDYEGAYAQWKNALAQQESATLDFNRTLQSVRTKLHQWEPHIYLALGFDTPEIKAVFPARRSPFYRGTADSRINAVKVLAKQLESYPALAATKADVAAFALLLQQKYDARITAGAETKEQSTHLEIKRKGLMEEMYGNLGLLMHHFRQRPANLKLYFDMGILNHRVHRKSRKEESKT